MIQISVAYLLSQNFRQMLHDPEVYSSPTEFSPDRYELSDTEMKKVTNLVFGFGRRACPGMHFALGTIYAIILVTLATCDILPTLDENNEEIKPEATFTPGVSR